MDLKMPKYQERSVRDFPVSDSWLIAGGPKDGKSTLCAAFSKTTLILDTQDGYKGISGLVWNIKSESVQRKISPLEMLKVMVQEVAKAKPDIDCIVLDCITDVDLWVQDEVCKRLGVRSIADAEYGKGFGQHATDLRKLLEFIRTLAPTALFVAHTLPDTDDFSNMNKTLWMPKRLKAWLPGYVDHTGWMFRTGAGSHFIEFSGYEVEDKGKKTIQVAGSRHKQLQGKTIPIAESDPWAAMRGLYKTNTGGKLSDSDGKAAQKNAKNAKNGKKNGKGNKVDKKKRAPV